MANITIRDLPDLQPKEALRVQAAQVGISLEAYARYLLQRASAAQQKKPRSLLEVADRYFGPEHGIDLELPERSSNRQDVDFAR